ncbi:MAG: UDP-N-acetylmuramoyl-L-alanyl-D-glutamate--2,6-diaminopimelate ligase [Selenomonadaceae bacterium]|nr:UDP-N-acetylmuramoyl-L-alanyl-D-glutamate--2,6-diaminopimelate ligase [Selenomonadaceae bacterium]
MKFSKTLEELALLVQNTKIIGDAKVKISSIEHDSRKISEGSLFVCFEGEHFDGHNFINQAFQAGAKAILTTRNNVEVPSGMSILIVPDILKALAVIVPYFYDYPSKKMRVIGVTGTNGKTTTTYMIRSILINAGYRVGLIGTIQTMIENEIFPIHNTTPNVIDLQHIFFEMLKRSIDYVVMEVSSHALAENRVAGIEFDTAVFTNLTQDHLDYHGTMENYLRAKTKLFDEVSRSGLKNNKTAVVNVDDEASGEILQHVSCNRLTYGIKNNSDLKAAEVDVRADGTKFKIRGEFGVMKLNLHVTGIFNVYNVLAAVGATLAEKIDPAVISKTLEHFKSVPGRFERIFADVPFTVIVDYAHTPDGVENVIETARQIVKNRVITVFGCGGDRDRTKRPIMGRLAADLSDIVIATSDNPRTENPTEILKEIEVGIKEKIGEKIYNCIEDRHAAIFHAVEIAQPGDIILILGKGHEDYQILKDRTIHFDDREVAHEAIAQKL